MGHLLMRQPHIDSYLKLGRGRRNWHLWMTASNLKFLIFAIIHNQH